MKTSRPVLFGQISEIEIPSTEYFNDQKHKITVTWKEQKSLKIEKVKEKSRQSKSCKILQGLDTVLLC